MPRSEVERAQRVVYGMVARSAALEAARLRTLAGVHFCERLERGLHARSHVLAALTRREQSLERRARIERQSDDLLRTGSCRDIRNSLLCDRARGYQWACTDVLVAARDKAAALGRRTVQRVIEAELRAQARLSAQSKAGAA